jgi:predicted  nucleic acid-binding Zn-ribbon protein
MEGKKHRKPNRDLPSREPYKRRSETEVKQIAKEIQAGELSIHSACRRYGMCRNTLKKALTRLSVRNLDDDLSRQIFSKMKEEKQLAALQHRVQELSKALQSARLKINGLETMIRVAEQELQIKIRKKAGAKRSTK